VPQKRIEAALEAFRAENMRELKPKFAWQIRAATVGNSRRHLNESILAVFRERRGDAICALGYRER
jgi:hypothetical protein